MRLQYFCFHIIILAFSIQLKASQIQIDRFDLYPSHNSIHISLNLELSKTDTNRYVYILKVFESDKLIGELLPQLNKDSTIRVVHYSEEFSLELKKRFGKNLHLFKTFPVHFFKKIPHTKLLKFNIEVYKVNSHKKLGDLVKVLSKTVRCYFDNLVPYNEQKIKKYNANLKIIDGPYLYFSAQPVMKYKDLRLFFDKEFTLLNELKYHFNFFLLDSNYNLLESKIDKKEWGNKNSLSFFHFKSNLNNRFYRTGTHRFFVVIQTSLGKKKLSKDTLEFDVKIPQAYISVFNFKQVLFSENCNADHNLGDKYKAPDIYPVVQYNNNEINEYDSHKFRGYHTNNNYEMQSQQIIFLTYKPTSSGTISFWDDDVGFMSYNKNDFIDQVQFKNMKLDTFNQHIINESKFIDKIDINYAFFQAIPIEINDFESFIVKKHNTSFVQLSFVPSSKGNYIDQNFELILLNDNKKNSYPVSKEIKLGETCKITFPIWELIEAKANMIGIRIKGNGPVLSNIVKFDLPQESINDIKYKCLTSTGVTERPNKEKMGYQRLNFKINKSKIYSEAKHLIRVFAADSLVFQSDSKENHFITASSTNDIEKQINYTIPNYSLINLKTDTLSIIYESKLNGIQIGKDQRKIPINIPNFNKYKIHIKLKNKLSKKGKEYYFKLQYNEFDRLKSSKKIVSGKELNKWSEEEILVVLPENDIVLLCLYSKENNGKSYQKLGEFTLNINQNSNHNTFNWRIKQSKIKIKCLVTQLE